MRYFLLVSMVVLIQLPCSAMMDSQDSIGVDLQATLDLGLQHFRANENDRAKASFLKILEQDSTSCLAGHAWNNLGLVSKREGKLYTALKLYDRALLLYDKGGLLQESIRTRFNAALLAGKLGEFDWQNAYLFRAVALADSIQDEDLQFYGYLYLGRAHKQKKQFQQAHTYYKKALFLANEDQHEKGLASLYNSMGNLFRELGKLEKAALAYQNSLKIKLRLKGKKALATGYHNLGATFFQMQVLDSAEFYYRKALELKLMLNQSGSESMGMTMNELARVLMDRGEFGDALVFLKKSLLYGEQQHLPALQMRSCELLKHYFLTQNMPDSVNWYTDRYLMFYQQHYDLAQAERFLLLQEKYESDKKDGLIDALRVSEDKLKEQAFIKDLKLNQQRNELRIKNLVLIVLVAFALLTFLFFWFYRQRNQLKQLKYYTKGQEVIKEKVALALHDKVANNISGIRMSMTALAGSNKEQQVLVDQLGELYEQVRDLSHDLSPARYRFEGLSFGEALMNLFLDFQRLYQIRVLYNDQTNGWLNKLSVEVAVEVYLIINELLQNVHKHARSKKVTIYVKLQKQRIVFELKDFGIGLPVSLKNGIGVQNIQARAKVIGARFELSNWENGAVATLIVPFNKRTHD